MRFRKWLSHRLHDVVVWLNPDYDFRAVAMVAQDQVTTPRLRLLDSEGLVFRPHVEQAVMYVAQPDLERMRNNWWGHARRARCVDGSDRMIYSRGER